MDVIKISEIKLLLLLSKDEVLRYSAELKASGRKKTIKTILEDAGENARFSESSALSVRLFQSKDGGCEMFVTKLDDNASGCDYLSESKVKKYIYHFKDTELFLTFCKFLVSLGRGDGMTVYKDCENKGFYLSSPEEISDIAELGGEKVPFPKALYISEHCEKMCGATLSLLASLGCE